MSDFTYEFENKNNRLEKYEWDTVWWECADTAGIPRVLYIGDSISCATRRFANEAAGHGIFFDGFGTSKAVDNPYFAESVRLFAHQQGERAVILFNNGLHGWHLEDETAYKQYYEQFLQFLMAEFECTPIVLLLTTAVADEKRNARVVTRNRMVTELAEAYQLPVVDLYAITHQHRDLLSHDGVHLTAEGYKLLAGELVAKVKEFLE